jgi:periplasmic protein TonB
MTESRCTAFVFSFLLHGVIIAALFTIPFFDVNKEASIVVNLSSITPTGGGQAGTSTRPKVQAKPEKQENASRPKRQDSARHQEFNDRQEIERKDEAGKIEPGLIGPAGHSEGSAAHRTISSPSPGSGPGDIKKLNYSGPGGADERHFSFIRDTIMQGIVYPERARRQGLEGKVILSFTVRENGSIDDVKVVTSSGFLILDDNARETISRTNFRKKVPVKLYVLLPVEYKLRP